MSVIEKPRIYHTSSDDPEKNPHQTHEQFHAQIRHRKEKDEVEEKGIQQVLQEEQEDRVLYQPTLWWFTSTAFPLIAGTFGPLASLFSICALVHTWRVENITRRGIPDPPWLTTLNACSLFLALIANLILSFNFAHRIRYAVAQPLTISLWYLSCLLLIVPISLTCLPSLSPSTNPTLVYSQSFFYAVISAILYFTISTLLLLNLLGASRLFSAYPPTFSVLTNAQRTLMLQTISFSIYLALGAGVFSAIEHWDFTDGLYWADYTVLTVGLGSDYPLKTKLGRMLLIPYAPFGIALVGLVVHSVMELVMERAKEKVVMRYLGKARDRWMDNINKKLKEKDESKGLQSVVPRLRTLLCCWHYKRDRNFQQLPRVIAHARSAQHQDQHGKWHRAEFELMRYIQFASEQSERYMTLVVSFLAFMAVWIGGSLVFYATEHKQRWTYTESLYFTYTTLLTIGYGDFYPESASGKPFFVVWSLVAVPTMTVFIGNMGDTVVRTVQEMTDWTGRKTLLPEYRKEDGKKQEKKPGEAKNDQASSDSDVVTEPNLVSPPYPPSRKSTVQNYGGHSLVSSSAEGQEAPVATEAESSLVLRGEGQPGASDLSARHKPQESKGKNSDRNANQVQAEAALLAREISKVAKDVCKHPVKKYEWEEWVNWLKILGDEEVASRKEKELEKVQVSMNLSNTAANLDSQGEHPHHDDSQHRHKHYRRYYSQPNDQLRVGRDGDGWHWTWLDDKGPLFSPETETEWILSRLCGRLEHLMSNHVFEEGSNK